VYGWARTAAQRTSWRWFAQGGDRRDRTVLAMARWLMHRRLNNDKLSG
jgi:hypothetical protein